MGDRCQVWIYGHSDETGWSFAEYWGGRSVVKMVWYAWRARRYTRCVRVEWRPVGMRPLKQGSVRGRL